MGDTENLSFWDKVEEDVRRDKKASECTVIDLLKEILPDEYDLALFQHEQERETIQRNLKYRPTIESKKELLTEKLNFLIKYLEDEEENQYRHIFGNLGQTTLDKVIEKIRSMYSLVQKAPIWKNLKHDEKIFFISLRNLPTNSIKEDMPAKEAYKMILKIFKLKPLSEEDKENKKTTINKQLIEITQNLFYDHFQVGLNEKLQEELKRLLDPTEYESKTNLSKKEESDKYLTIPVKVKDVKNRKEIDLEQDHYALLTYYFQKGRIFLNDPNISDVSASKAMQILNGYNHENIRKKLGKLEFTNNQKVVVKEKLEEIITLINKDLPKK